MLTFLLYFSGSTHNLKTQATIRNCRSNLAVEKSPMMASTHSVRGGQQQQRADDVRAARKQVSRYSFIPNKGIG